MQRLCPAVLWVYLFIPGVQATAAPQKPPAPLLKHHRTPQTRIKDIVAVEGVRENMLVGYGLVVGLSGTGDGLRNTPFTKESLHGMLERMGINVRDYATQLDTKNVAGVIITATLPPFARKGGRLDVTVSALGNAKSLVGGVLLVAPLMGADNQVYAVAQGPLVVGAVSAQSKATGSSFAQNTATTAAVPGGAIIEQEIPYSFKEGAQNLRLILKTPDFTTAERIQDAINATFGFQVAQAIDPSTVCLMLPPMYQENPFAFVARIERLAITPDSIARVIVDERTGTVIIGQHVRVSPIAISHGNLTIRISESKDVQVSQPNPFSQGGTVATVTPKTTIDVDQEDSKLAIVSGATLADLVEALRELGVGPRDLISILRSIEAGGALHGRLEVR